MNKIIKKFFIFIMFLTLFSPSLVKAYDMGNIKVDVSKVPEKVGDQFKVKFNFDKGENNVYALTVKYNTKFVELVSLEEGDSKPYREVKKTEGNIEFRGLKSSGTIVTFKVKAEGVSNIDAQVGIAYIDAEDRNATNEELKTLKASTKIELKPVVVEEKKPETNTEKPQQPAETTTPESTSTATSTFSRFLHSIGEDWVLKVLFVAIIVIILIILTLIVEGIVTSSKNKKRRKHQEIEEVQSADTDTIVKPMRQVENDYSINITEKEVQAAREKDMRNRINRELERNYETFNNSQANRQQAPRRRELTIEEKRILLAKKRLYDQKISQKREARRPIKKDND